jgi:hypothetical protein
VEIFSTKDVLPHTQCIKSNIPTATIIPVTPEKFTNVINPKTKYTYMSWSINLCPKTAIVFGYVPLTVSSDTSNPSLCSIGYRESKKKRLGS